MTIQFRRTLPFNASPTRGSHAKPGNEESDITLLSHDATPLTEAIDVEKSFKRNHPRAAHWRQHIQPEYRACAEWRRRAQQRSSDAEETRRPRADADSSDSPRRRRQ